MNRSCQDRLLGTKAGAAWRPLGRVKTGVAFEPTPTGLRRDRDRTPGSLRCAAATRGYGRQALQAWCRWKSIRTRRAVDRRTARPLGGRPPTWSTARPPSSHAAGVDLRSEIPRSRTNRRSPGTNPAKRPPPPSGCPSTWSTARPPSSHAAGVNPRSDDPRSRANRCPPGIMFGGPTDKRRNADRQSFVCGLPRGWIDARLTPHGKTADAPYSKFVIRVRGLAGLCPGANCVGSMHAPASASAPILETARKKPERLQSALGESGFLQKRTPQGSNLQPSVP